MSARDGFETALAPDLVCQYCGEALVLEPRWASEAASIETGILRCRCQRYPIVAGIVVAKRDTAGPFLRLYDDSDSTPDASARAHAHLTGTLGMAPGLVRGRGTFVEAIDVLIETLPRSAREWPLHAQHWYRTPKYLALLPLLELLARAAPRQILDLGCGAGHFAWQAASYSGADTVFAVDAELFHLLAARWWILESTPHVCLLCADANEPLPIRDASIDAVISSDALHYVANKARAIRELARVRRASGIAVLSHLHNALKSNIEIQQGASLEPGAWHLLFERHLGAEYAMVPDDDLRRAATGDDSSSRVEPARMTVLAAARSISVIGGAGPWHVSWRDSVVHTRGVDGDIINPIYEIAGEHDEQGGSGGNAEATRRDGDWRVLRLRRRTLSESFEYEFASGTPPKTAVLDLARAAEDPLYREQVRRRALLAIAPPRYSSAFRVSTFRAAPHEASAVRHG